jgi:heme-degrading monooxygenase HmoA
VRSHYTTGIWRPCPEEHEALIRAWGELADSASSLPGAEALILTHETRYAERYVSICSSRAEADVRAWKATPEFREHMAQVLRYVDDFQPTQLTPVARAGARPNGSEALL